MGDTIDRILYKVPQHQSKTDLIREKIDLLEVIRNHLEYTLRYEHRFHAFDVSSLNSALNKIKLVIDMYVNKLDEGFDFWSLDKDFFVAFDWIEKTFKDDLISGDNRRISVLYIHFLTEHLQDLVQIYNEAIHTTPSLVHQMLRRWRNR